MNILLQVLLAMFGSDDIELDFDDDFSCNIFCKRVATGKGDAVERGRVDASARPSGKSMTPSQLHREESKASARTSSSGALSLAPRVTPKDNSLKRPLLQDENPSKKRLSHETLLPRKFPGPAGLLPDKQPFNQISDLPLPPEESWNEEQDSSDKEKSFVVYSQSSGSVFLESGYQKLVNDFSLNDSGNPLNKYTVDWVKRTALSKGLQGRKIPFLGLVIHAVNHSMPDPVLILRDPTGEITGSLHREVWAEMGGKLRAGIALALRQVGVLITGVIRRQIYLNITMNNILAVYRPCESEREVEITRVNKVSQSELVKNLGEWRATSRAAPRAPPSPCGPFPFTSIEDSSRGSAKGAEVGKLKRGSWEVEVGKEEGVVSDLGVVLRDSDFREEMRVPESLGQEGGRGTVLGAGASIQALSPAESLIFEEVLSGIDLDEFDM